MVLIAIPLNVWLFLNNETFQLIKQFSSGTLAGKLYPYLLKVNRAMSTVENDVIVQDEGDKGIIILNRPKALNSLNLSMVDKIYPALKKWESEKKLVIVKGKMQPATHELMYHTFKFLLLN